MPDPDAPDRLPVDTSDFEAALVSKLITVFETKGIVSLTALTNVDIGGTAPGLEKERRVVKGSLHASPWHSGAKQEDVPVLAGPGEHGKFLQGEDLYSAVRLAVHDTLKGEVVTGVRVRGYADIDADVYAIAQVVGSTLRQARHRHSESTIEKLVHALVETQDPVAKVSASIDADNAAARVRFMNNFTAYTSQEVTENAGSGAKNKSQLPSRWKSEGRIFSVPWRNQERFPAFQFKDGQPLPVIAQILEALPGEMSSWEIAFWFVSGNSWLEGAAPKALLKKGGGKVIEAARNEATHLAG